LSIEIDSVPYVRTDPDGTESLHLMVEDAHCAACIRRIEDGLRRRDGVVEARLNLTTRRLVVRWRKGAAGASELVDAIAALGYRAVPFDPRLLASRDDAESKLLLRCLAVAGFAAANVMLMSVALWAGAFSGMGEATRGFLHWLSALIVLPALAYAARPFVRSAISALRARSLNMDVPISLAIVLTTAMSLLETVRGGAHVYFDAAAMLTFFLLIGRTLDRGARSRARAAAEQLGVLGAGSATVIDDDGNSAMLPVAAVKPGMTIAVAAGERIPVDGEVSQGISALDTSLVTGETLPRAVAPGETVHAGTINLDRPIRVRATAADEKTLLAEIVRLVEAAAQGQARHVRLADRVARVYAPAVHVLAATTFLGWLTFGGLGWQPALMIAVSVLIITCPCALGLAVPVVQVVAAGRLMKQGILLKSPDGLERLAEADHVVFDKTGTLTLGRPVLIGRDELSDDDLHFAARMAAASRHPLSRALVRAAGPVTMVEGIHEEPGLGLAVEIDGAEARLGSRAWCAVDGPVATGPELWLARPGRAPVRFAFEDLARADAAAAIDALRRRGYGIELVSGDRSGAVEAVARAVGITDWRAESRPSAKTDRLAELAALGRKPVMIGDGLNDAPALASAHASISPVAAADISRAAADVLFQGDRLAPVVETLDVARRARRLMIQNFALALGYNALAVPLAMAGLITPLYAAAAMSASSLVVTLNAFRLRWRWP
jgi:Cu2+-exporting ATPase